MATGATRPPCDVLFPPSHVVMRLSTDTPAMEDPALARALRFIRESGQPPGQFRREARQQMW